MFTSVLSVFGDVLAPRPNKRKEIWAFLRGGQYDKALLALREPNHGFMANEKDTKSGLTALHFAAAAGKLDLIIELIVQGADVNAADEAGNTCLHFATQNNQRSAVEVLLRYGALPGATNNSGLYPVEMTTNPAVTELFQRDKFNIFSPVVAVRPTLLPPEEDPELLSEKILGSDLLEDLTEEAEKLQIETNTLANATSNKEDYTIVGVSSATKPARNHGNNRGNTDKHTLLPALSIDEDDGEQSHQPLTNSYAEEHSQGQASPLLPALSSHLPPPPVHTPPGKSSHSHSHSHSLSSPHPLPHPLPSINQHHPSGLFSPSSFHQYYTSHVPPAAPPAASSPPQAQSPHPQAPPQAHPALSAATRHTSVYDLSQSRLLQAAQETAKVYQLTTEEFEARRMIVRYCQKYNEKGLRQYLLYDPTLPMARLADLGGLAVDGQTPLHVAARFNNLDALQLFAAVGVGVSFWVIDLQGRTPLHIAAEYQHDRVCAYLKEQMKQEMSGPVQHHPVGVFAPLDLGGNTPLGCAKLSAKGKPKKELEEILFERGDRSVLPLTPHELRTGKSPWKPLPPSSAASATPHALPITPYHLGTPTVATLSTPYHLGTTPYHTTPGSATGMSHATSHTAASTHSHSHHPYASYPSYTAHPAAGNKDANLLYAYSEAHGWTPTMEDRLVIACPLHLKPTWSLFIVFDGHGGSFVSSFLAAQFPGVLMEVTRDMEKKYGTSSGPLTDRHSLDDTDIQTGRTNQPTTTNNVSSSGTSYSSPGSPLSSPPSANVRKESSGPGGGGGGGVDDLDTTPEFLQEILCRACMVADEQLRQHARMKVSRASTGDLVCRESSGSTGTIVLVTPFYIAVANVGDSRTVLAKRLLTGESAMNAAHPAGSSGSAVGASGTTSSSAKCTNNGVPVLHDPFAMANLIQTSLEDLSIHDTEQGTDNTITDTITNKDTDGNIGLPTASAGAGVGVCGEKDKKVRRGSNSGTGKMHTVGLQGIALSRDHTGVIVEERQRIEQSGAIIQRVEGTYAVDGEESTGCKGEVWEVYTPSFPGRLRMTRSFGDFYLKQQPGLCPEQQPVIALPEVKIHPRQSSDAFLVLACDGIWDVMSNQEVVDFVGEGLGYTVFGSPVGGIPPQALATVCDNLLAECLHRGSHDNMSVIVIVPNTPPHLTGSNTTHSNAIPLLLPSTPTPPTPSAALSASGEIHHTSNTNNTNTNTNTNTGVTVSGRRKSLRSSKDQSSLEMHLPSLPPKHDEIDITTATVQPHHSHSVSVSVSHSLPPPTANPQPSNNHLFSSPEPSNKSRALYDLLDDDSDELQSPLNTKVGTSHLSNSIRKQLTFQ